MQLKFFVWKELEIKR